MSWTAGKLMQTKVRTVAEGTSLPALERAFLDEGVTGFPVVEEGRLVGVVSRSDVVRKLATEQSYAEYISDYHREICGVQDEEPEPLSTLAHRAGARLENVCVRDLMSRSPITVSPNDSLNDVAKVLVDRRIHRVVVTSGEKLEGIITSLDLVALFAEDRVAPR
jgi:CBS domain-containing protein